MPDFLSDEWFERTNDTLRAAGPVPLSEGQAVFRLVLEFADAPSSGPHAMTFSLSAEEASVAAGDHLAADAIIRLSFADASALAAGTFDSATALRQGRVKVRGDINAIVPLLTWLQGAHPGAAE